MKKHIIALSLLVFSTASLIARPVATGNPSITCNLHKMDEDEIEKLLFNQETASFLKASLRSADTAEIAFHGHTHGHHSTAAEVEKYSTIKNLHERFQPFKVTITNNSDEPIMIEKNRYINTLTETLATYKRILKFYPNFKSAQVLNYIFGSILGGVSVITLVGAVIAFANDPKLGGLALIPTALFTFLTYTLFRIGAWAGRLHKRKIKLGKTKPTLRTAAGCKRKVKQSNITIAPGQTLTDVLLVNAQSIQTSSAVFGAAESIALVYHLPHRMDVS